MENNQFLLLNNLIYQIYNTSNFDVMRKRVLELLQVLIPNSASSIFVADPTKPQNLLNSPICIPESFYETENRYMKLENEDESRWMLMCGESMVIRESDLMADKQRIQSKIYKQCYTPLGLYYAVQLTLGYYDDFLGVVSLYRKQEEGDFTDQDIFYLRSLGRHLSSRFYRYIYADNTSNTASTSSIPSLAAKYRLTNREVDVLRLIFEEKNNALIIQDLGISIHTLKKHIQNLYIKLGVSTRWEILSFRN